MPWATRCAIHWAEQGRLPDAVVRLGVRRLLRERLQAQASGDVEAESRIAQRFAQSLREAPLAPLSQQSRAQHYELPPAFFAAVLGPHRKYSCCCWDGTHGATDEALGAAEAQALRITCERAGIADGQRILELGCGWGALSLWLAERHPRSHVTAMSHAQAQRETIQALAAARGLRNLEVITCDFPEFEAPGRYDRIVSVEMFEHLRNWPQAFERVARWLEPDGRFFMHVFTTRGSPYAFDDQDDGDWMSRHFFSGGMMPSDDLPWRCQDHLRVLGHWRWSGRHYQRTAEAWLARMDAARAPLMPQFEQAYGARDAGLWWQRWRVFFLSVSELFGHDAGRHWHVGHYLFAPRGPAS